MKRLCHLTHLQCRLGLLLLSLKKLFQLSLCMPCPLDQGVQVNDRTGTVTPTFLAAQTSCEGGVVVTLP